MKPSRTLNTPKRLFSLVLIVVLMLSAWADVQPASSRGVRFSPRLATINKSGTITADETWTSDNVYLIVGTVGVAPGVTLTIQAGTMVKFNGNYSLNVGGTMVADGAEGQPIQFMSNTGSTWDQISFYDTSVDATTDANGVYLAGNLVRYVQMTGAANGITCASATPYLSHVTTDGGGVNCTAGNTPLWLADSDVIGNVMVQIGPGVPNGWMTRANMPTPRTGLGVTMANNGKIYAIGGDGGLGDIGSSVVEEYNPVTDSWTTRANMPTPRSRMGVITSSNGKIYAIGGINNPNFSGAVEEYNPATDTWTTRTSMPTPRAALGVAAANGKFYAIGGAGGSNVVEEYDPATDTWTARANMPTARTDLGVVTASNGKIYAIGGSNGSSFLAIVEEYDPTTNIWTTRANMPAPRVDMGVATASNGKIYAIGGWNYNVLSVVGKYDPATDTWTTCANMPTPRSLLGVTSASNGGIYAIGGGNGATGAVFNTVEEFNSTPLSYGSFNIQRSNLRGDLSTPEDSQVLDSTIGGNVNVGSNFPGYTNIVQNTTASGITVNGSGTVTGNTVTGGGISLGSGQVLSNTITGGGISAGAGSTIQDNNIENAIGWGIATSGSATITHNRVVGSANGISASAGTIQGNLVANSTGVGLQVGGDATVSNNTLTGNGGSALRISSGAPVIHNNNFEFNIGTYDLENLSASAINASDNWWGTTDAAAIGARIFDYLEDFTKGQVTYAPILTGPDQTAPGYVRNVTVTPDPVGIETATFDVEFNRPMDTNSSPVMEFYDNIKGTWSQYNTSNSGLPYNYFYSIAIESNGVKWFGTAGGGVASFDGTTWHVYNTSNSGLPENTVWSIAIESNGVKWFGTYRGLASFDGTTWHVYDTSNSGLPNNEVYLIVIDGNGVKWFGTNSGGVASFDGTTWHVYNTSNSGLPNNGVSSIAIDSNGTKWFGTSGGGVVSFDGTSWRIYSTSNSGLPSNNVNSIVIESNGTKWFGTVGGSGVGSFDGKAWHVYNTSNSGLPSNDVAEVAIESDGTKWFGTGHGVANFDGATWHVYNTSNSGLPNNEVYSMTIESNGTKWFGTYGGGIGILYGANTYTITNSSQWSSPTQYSATYDITSAIPRGIYRVDVSNAFDSDGMRIAPYSNATFTINYPGISGDAGVGGATLSYTDGTDKTATADAGGNYSFAVSENWSGTVTPSKPGYTFTPPSRTYDGVMTEQTAQDYTATAITYTISGNVGVAGATVTYTGGSTTADSAGDYSFKVAYGWSGTVTPSLAGYTFEPPSRGYINVTADQIAQDYTATAVTYTISGNVGIAGATVTYTGGSTTANGLGAYSFTVPSGWSGTVTPSLTGYTFDPPSRDYTNVTADQTAQEYIATAITYTISGNAGVGGAKLNYTDGTSQTATADLAGNYSLKVSYNWSGTVTPSKANYTFSPSNRTYTNVLDNISGEDYTATSIVYTGKYYSTAKNDGWVLELSERSNKGGSFDAISKYFQLGDDVLNRQYKVILSFNLKLPAGTIIKSAMLRIKSSGKPIGSNPFTVLGNLLVDVRKGAFGMPNLEASDFQMMASAKNAGAFGKIPAAGWYKATLSPAGISKITLNGLTQFRLYFSKDDNNDFGADSLKFFSGNSPIGKPELVITYTVP